MDRFPLPPLATRRHLRLVLDRARCTGASHPACPMPNARTDLTEPCISSGALFVWTYQHNQQPSSSVFLSQQTSEQYFQHNKPAKRTGWGSIAPVRGSLRPSSEDRKPASQHAAQSQGLFSSKNFQDSLSHQIFERMHEVLNIDKK
jgi:hypothetical protein